jgi:hypothetical protein
MLASIWIWSRRSRTRFLVLIIFVIVAIFIAAPIVAVVALDFGFDPFSRFLSVNVHRKATAWRLSRPVSQSLERWRLIEAMHFQVAKLYIRGSRAVPGRLVVQPIHLKRQLQCRSLFHALKDERANAPKTDGRSFAGLLSRASPSRLWFRSVLLGNAERARQVQEARNDRKVVQVRKETKQRIRIRNTSEGREEERWTK